MSDKLNEWVDTTTYSRNQSERKPSCWTYDTGKMRITVLTGHRYHPDRWVMHCHELNMDTVVLKAPIETPVADVQAAAIRVVRKQITEMINSLPTP